MQRGCACLKLAGPYSNWLGHTQKATRVWCSWLHNTQNLGFSDFPNYFRIHLMWHDINFLLIPMNGGIWSASVFYLHSLNRT